MLGKLHLSGLSLLPGAMGLYWFYGRLFPSVPKWIVWAVLLLPWLTIHIITFFNQPPFGPRPFRRCLLAVAGAYASLVAIAEAIQFVHPLPPDGGITLTHARVLMAIGCLCFIPFARAYRILRDPGSTTEESRPTAGGNGPRPGASLRPVGGSPERAGPADVGIGRTLRNAPARYQYDPPWVLVAFPWTLAVGLVIVVLAGYFPSVLGIVASLGFALLGTLTTLRRYAFPRSLVIDEEGLWLPSGFLRMNVRRVLFAEVSDVWEAFLPFTAVLCLRSHGKTFEIVSTLLPNHETYQAVGESICDSCLGNGG